MSSFPSAEMSVVEIRPLPEMAPSYGRSLQTQSARIYKFKVAWLIFFERVGREMRGGQLISLEPGIKRSSLALAWHKERGIYSIN